MSFKIIELAQGERIVAVVPEYANGAEWRNALVWVHIEDSSQQLRTESIQAEEMTPAMHTLFGVAEAMVGALFSAVPARKAKKEKS